MRRVEEKLEPSSPVRHQDANDDARQLLETAKKHDTVDAWRYRWAVEWAVYDHSGMGVLRRQLMGYVREKYSDVTKYLREKEDVLTAEYVGECEAVLSGTYLAREGGEQRQSKERFVLPRFMTKKQLYDHTDAEFHDDIGFGMDCAHRGVPGSLPMDVKNKADYQGDLYETTTRSFLWHRLREEQRDAATASIALMSLAVISLALGGVIIGLATRELSGGKQTVVVSGLVSGGVMVVAAVVGFIGALSADESWVRVSMTGGLFTMIVLTTLLYIEINHIVETEKDCSPSNTDHTAGSTSVSGDCAEQRAEVSSLLVASAVATLTQFFVTYTASVLLDAVNDGERLADTLLLFRYFNYRTQCIQTKLDKTYGKPKFGEGSQLGTYNNISPAYAAAHGMHLSDTKLNTLDIDGNTEPIVSH